MALRSLFRRQADTRVEAPAPTAYVAPLAVFSLFTALESALPASIYPVLYLVKMCAVTAALAFFRHTLRDIRPSWRLVAPSILVGLAVCGAWVGIDRWVPYPHLGGRAAYDPFSSIESAEGAAGFLVIRFYGLVLLVPVMEELFWRSFLLRYLTESRFSSVPMGTFSPMAFCLVAAFTGLAHPEWLVAAIASAIYTLLLRHTRSLFAVTVAHAVTNAALGVYILSSHNWQYW